jgi:hypothetical protein
MKFIFHIGMGKTGTSSVQSALQGSEEPLAAAKAKYLGMWLGMIDPKFNGIEGINEFFEQKHDQIRVGAKKFVKFARHLAEQEGFTTFVLSNEAIFIKVEEMRPFFEEVAAAGQLQLVAYVRHPSSWVPSAYTQWGVNHKTYPGPIKPFRERMHQLMQQYESLRPWHTNFGEKLIVRAHDATDDVVFDFAAATGLPLISPSSRQLQRAGEAEIIFRAIFNDRFPTPMLPWRFDRTVINPQQAGGVRRVEEMIDRCFNTKGIEGAIEKHSDIFALLRDSYGIDYTGPVPQQDNRLPDPDMVRKQLMEYLLETVIRQSQRITIIENKLATITELNKKN